MPNVPDSGMLLLSLENEGLEGPRAQHVKFRGQAQRACQQEFTPTSSKKGSTAQGRHEISAEGSGIRL